MFSQIHYLLRSKIDGKYLTARPNQNQQYLLLFRESFEALSYINTHAGDLADRFLIDSIAGTNLKDLLQRWGFQGVGIVSDPLLPQIEFLSL